MKKLNEEIEELETYINGYRNDKTTLEKLISKYDNEITMFSGAFVSDFYASIDEQVQHCITMINELETKVIKLKNN